MAPTKNAPEELKSLPTGHPKAGYTAPVLDGQQGVGTLPDNEQEWHDDNVQARQDAADEVAQYEDEIARQENEDRLAADEETAAAQEKATKSAAASKSTSTSSTGS